MKKYVIIAAGITFLLICTSFVSSSRNILEIEHNIDQNGVLSCDHIGYVLGSGEEGWLYEFPLNNPSDLTCVCEGGSCFTYGGAITNDNLIYTTEYGTGIIWMIDPESCEWYAIGGGGAGYSALSFDPISGYLYTTEGAHLWKIDIETGELELIGSFGNVNMMIDLAFDTEGTLYGWDILYDTLWIIDTETADLTEVGEMGINLNYVAYGDFCKEDNILYITTIGPSPDYIYQLYECDTETGECSHIGQFPEDFELSIFAIPWINHPPYKPCNPRPMNGTTGVVYGPGFTCDTGDPDGDELIYDLYWGVSNPPPLVLSNVSELWYDPYGGEWPLFNTTIYWKVVVKDEHGASVEGDIWHITYAKNYPPYPAKNPNPANGAEQVPVNASLSWTGWDPNGWEELTYDVYFGLYDPPTQQTYNQTKTSYDPYGTGDMQLFETYYWKIVTRDREGESSVSPTWTFKTGYCGLPVPKIVGPTKLKINVEYNYTFSIDTEDKVCFEVKWGDGTSEIFCPPLNLSYVIANHTWNMIGSFTIWVRCFDEHGNYGDWGNLNIEIPREKSIYYFLYNFILERYPLLGVFLRIT